MQRLWCSFLYFQLMIGSLASNRCWTHRFWILNCFLNEMHLSLVHTVVFSFRLASPRNYTVGTEERNRPELSCFSVWVLALFSYCCHWWLNQPVLRKSSVHKGFIYAWLFIYSSLGNYGTQEPKKSLVVWSWGKFTAFNHLERWLSGKHCTVRWYVRNVQTQSAMGTI